MVRITQLRRKCIGCNACVEAAFSRWRISQKDGKAVLLSGKEKKGTFSALVFDDEFENNKVAEKNCPVSCIRVEKLT